MNKICMITTVHSVFDIRIFHKECKTLVNAGYEVILIAQHSHDEIVNGVHIRAIAKTSGRFKRMFITTFSALVCALKEKATIYHFHDPELLPVGIILKILGKRVIYDVHEDVPRQILSKEWIPQYLRKLTAFITEFVENTIVQYLDGVVAATPYIAERFFKKSKHVITINNFPLINELINENVSWEEKEKTVCYVGGITVERGIVEIIKSIEKADVRLLLAGDFYPVELLEQVKKLKGWKYTDFKGFLGRDKVKQTVSRSMAGLVVLHPLTNYINAQPIKMFEYMSAGIPVIASNFPLWKEIIEGNNCGICVNPFDVDAIAGTIEKIINDSKLAKQLGANGRKAIEEKYNWEHEGRELIKFYDELIV